MSSFSIMSTDGVKAKASLGLHRVSGNDARHRAGQSFVEIFEDTFDLMAQASEEIPLSDPSG